MFLIQGQHALTRDDRIARYEHRFRRRIGVDDRESLVDEEQAEGETVEDRREGRRLDRLEVEEIADRHRPSEVGAEKTKRVSLHIIDQTYGNVPVESQIAEQRRVS